MVLSLLSLAVLHCHQVSNEDGSGEINTLMRQLPSIGESGRSYHITSKVLYCDFARPYPTLEVVTRAVKAWKAIPDTVTAMNSSFSLFPEFSYRYPYGDEIAISGKAYRRNLITNGVADWTYIAHGEEFWLSHARAGPGRTANVTVYQVRPSMYSLRTLREYNIDLRTELSGLKDARVSPQDNGVVVVGINSTGGHQRIVIPAPNSGIAEEVEVRKSVQEDAQFSVRVSHGTQNSDGLLHPRATIFLAGLEGRVHYAVLEEIQNVKVKPYEESDYDLLIPPKSVVWLDDSTKRRAYVYAEKHEPTVGSLLGRLRTKPFDYLTMSEVAKKSVLGNWLVLVGGVLALAFGITYAVRHQRHGKKETAGSVLSMPLESSKVG